MSDETKAAERECLCSGAGPAFTRFLREIGPPAPAKEHFDQARVEILKGLRALIDYRIEQISKVSQKGTKLTVE